MGKTVLMTQAPRKERGYEEMLMKNGFYRTLDNFYPVKNRALKEARKKFVTDEKFRPLVSMNSKYVDYINYAKRLKFAEKKLEGLIRHWAKVRDISKKSKRKMDKPPILK